MSLALFALDALLFGFVCASAWFWYTASRNRIRRVTRHERLDAADINRMVVAINRSQILNARAALTTACAGLIAFLRLLADVSLLARG